ncbi:MAG: EVE domain-containing protein [Gemmatimonadota bacterium]|nr:EVE domain-containing protein [Gemmatimonadota bacterium]
MPAKKTRAATAAKEFATTAAPATSGPWAAVFAPRARGERRFWLVKSEPDVFSWDDLMAARGRTTHWNGVRNHAARNFMRDGMRTGDLVFFYHSNAEPSAVVGICEVVREAYPDATAFDRSHDGYDAKSSPDAPAWVMVDLRAVERLPRAVTLPMIKAAKPLAQMALLRVGRLSVTPVTAAEWAIIVAMGRA